jgi:hypothetical protein
VLEQAINCLARISEGDWVHVAEAPTGKVDYNYLNEAE